MPHVCVESHSRMLLALLGQRRLPVMRFSRSGRDSIFVYSFNQDGTLHHLNEVPSHGNKGHEGPRHSIPSADGKKLYVVTEHSASSPFSSCDRRNARARAPQGPPCTARVRPH